MPMKRLLLRPVSTRRCAPPAARMSTLADRAKSSTPLTTVPSGIHRGRTRRPSARRVGAPTCLGRRADHAVARRRKRENARDARPCKADPERTAQVLRPLSSSARVASKRGASLRSDIAAVEAGPTPSTRKGDLRLGNERHASGIRHFARDRRPRRRCCGERALSACDQRRSARPHGDAQITRATKVRVST
jgi:hypothetical protein